LSGKKIRKFQSEKLPFGKKNVFRKIEHCAMSKIKLSKKSIGKLLGRSTLCDADKALGDEGQAF
jgi:hypothetical protein